MNRFFNRPPKRSVFLILVSLLCILSLAGCSKTERKKAQIIRMVTENRETLMQDIADWDFTDSDSIEGIEFVNLMKPYEVYDCGGHGIAPSSTEYGFYYSPDDRPLGAFENIIFSTGKGLSKDGTGYSGNFSGNRYYTEKICDGLWYYEFHF